VTSILEGWEPPAIAGDPRLRHSLEEEAARDGPQALHRRLSSIDPESAARIDPRNLRRLVRALEVAALTGQPPSRQRGRRPPPYRILRLGLTLPRAELYARIDARIDAMIAAGWVGEVRRLLGQGYSPELPSFSAIGYQQLADVALGRSSLEDAVRSIRRATRQFVRRQANWFKPEDPRIQWLPADAGVVDALEERVRGWFAAE
jgi:tRNA dimethylallyltransferase